MLKLRFQFALIGLSVSFGVLSAELMTSNEAADMLKRASLAARGKTYSGVYEFQGAAGSMSFRVFHQVDSQGEKERRETLDGEPAEYIRNGDQVTYFAAGQRPEHIDKQTSSRYFPAIAPDQIADVLGNYVFRRVAVERVAGVECVSIALVPKDRLRNPHTMCVDLQSGLVLRFIRYAPGWTEAVEKVAFMQLDVGGTIDKGLLKSTLAAKALPDVSAAGSDAHAVSAHSPEMGEVPRGFRLMQTSATLLDGKPDRQARQYIFTDGIAVVSVFVERSSGEPVAASSLKGTSFYARQINGWRVTAIGEVPAQTVQMFVQSFMPRQ